MSHQRTRGVLGLLLASFMIIATTSPSTAAIMASKGSPQSSDQHLTNETYVSKANAYGAYTAAKRGSATIQDRRTASNQTSSPSAADPACIACGNGLVNIWIVSKVGSKGTQFGAYKTIASGTGPGTLSKTVTQSRSNTYSGTLSASKSAVSLAVGFSISTSVSSTTTYEGQLLPKRKGYLQVRPVYETQKVKQEYRKGGKITKTTYLTAKKFKHFDYRIRY